MHDRSRAKRMWHTFRGWPKWGQGSAVVIAAFLLIGALADDPSEEIRIETRSDELNSLIKNGDTDPASEGQANAPEPADEVKSLADVPPTTPPIVTVIPSATAIPPTPTATAVPPTSTPVPPTATAIPPTPTPVPPTATAVPPTPVPPTPIPPPPTPVPQAAPAAPANCTPGYDPCIPPGPDVDCAGGSADGPRYVGRTTVTGSDPYGLDHDNDGIGCKNS